MKALPPYLEYALSALQFAELTGCTSAENPYRLHVSSARQLMSMGLVQETEGEMFKLATTLPNDIRSLRIQEEARAFNEARVYKQRFETFKKDFFPNLEEQLQTALPRELASASVTLKHSIRDTTLLISCRGLQLIIEVTPFSSQARIFSTVYSEDFHLMQEIVSLYNTYIIKRIVSAIQVDVYGKEEA